MIHFPRRPQHKNLNSMGVSIAAVSNAGAVYEVAKRAFTGVRRELEKPGDSVPKTLSLEALVTRVVGVLREANPGCADGIEEMRSRSSALLAIAEGRDRPACSRLRLAAQRTLETETAAQLEWLRQEIEAQPARAMDLLQDNLLGVAPTGATPGGRSVRELRRAAGRVQEFLSLRAELCDEVLNRAPPVLSGVLAALVDKAEQEVARSALEEHLPEVKARMSSELDVLAAQAGAVMAKLDRVGSELASRAAAAQSAESVVGRGGFEILLPGLTADELTTQVAASLEVDARKLPAAVGAKLAQALREKLERTRSVEDVQRCSLAKLLARVEVEDVIAALLNIIQRAIGEQAIYRAIQFHAGGVRRVAEFLWRAAAPTAPPSEIGVPQLQIHTTKVNKVRLPASDDQAHVRDELLSELRRLAAGECGIGEIATSPSENTITVERLVCAMPPAAADSNPALLSTYGEALREGHDPTLLEPPQRARDAARLAAEVMKLCLNMRKENP